MRGTTIGLDLAKNVFQVRGFTADGTVAFNRSLRRAQMFTFFQKLEPCLIGMEACGFSHYWARELSKLGRVVKLIAPVHVKPSADNLSRCASVCAARPNNATALHEVTWALNFSACWRDRSPIWKS